MSGLGLRVVQTGRRAIGSINAIPAIWPLLLAQGGPLVAQTAIGLLSAGLLGPSAKGTGALAITVATLGGATVFLSLHVGVVHATTAGDRHATVRALKCVSILAAIPLIVGIVTGVGGIGEKASERQLALLLGLVAVSFDAPFLVVVRTVQGLGQARAYRNAVLVRVIVYGLGIIGGAWIGLTPSRMVCAFIIGDIAGLMYGSRALRAVIGRGPDARPAIRVPILRQSFQAHCAVLSQQASYRADVILLGVWATPAELGQYSVATAIAEALWVVSEAISLSVFATTARQRLVQDRVGMGRTLYHAVKVNIIASLAGGALVGAGSLVLLDKVLPAYRPAFGLILVLLPGIAVGGIARLVLSSAIAGGRAEIVRASVMMNCVLTPVYIPFIATGSAYGAAVASDLIYVGMAASLVWHSRRCKRSSRRREGER